MGHLPVIENVWRATFHWNDEAGADHPVSVQHFRSELPPVDIAGQLDDSFQVHQLEGLRDACEVTSLDLLPLDGVGSTQTFTLENWHGSSGSGDALVGQAIVVLGRTGIRGPRNRGRIFLPSPLESVVTMGAMIEANRAEIEEAWNDFVQDAFDNGVEYGVASYRSGGNFEAYTSMHVDSKLGRIRRRQRG